ncbi:MAG: hypothetical protein QW548_02640 [Candidatus Aenigmatarchaeota archaeon]
MYNSFEKRILDTLQASEGIGVTIQDVSKLTSINRITAAKYLAVMEARGIVRCRRVGRAKLYFPNKPTHQNVRDALKAGAFE